MNRWLVASLLCFALFLCVGFALAEPGDLMAAHTTGATQASPALDSGDALTAAIAPVVTAAAPFLPAPWNGLAVALLPLVGIISNLWWRWRHKDIAATTARQSGLLLAQGIAYAEEKNAAAKKAGSPLSPAATLQEAVNYVSDNDIGSVPLFTGIREIEQRVTSALGRIPGVGATGNQVI